MEAQGKLVEVDSVLVDNWIIDKNERVWNGITYGNHNGELLYQNWQTTHNADNWGNEGKRCIVVGSGKNWKPRSCTNKMYCYVCQTDILIGTA